MMSRSRITSFAPIFVVLLATFSVYFQVVSHDFLNFDDDIYVTDHKLVQRGLSPQVVWDVVVRPYTGLYIPLAWISHIVDVELFGMAPAGHHLVSLLFHVANTLLFYALFFYTTRAAWPSALAAALFALHPLHVEAVAWIASRKDLLCMFFALLAYIAYARYASRRSLGMYGLALAMFVLSMMSKAMAITLPVTLLLLDYWPLKRLGNATIRTLLVEKFPFFAVSAAFVAMTVYASVSGGSMRSLEEVSLSSRFLNPPVSYVLYLWHTIFPVGLAAPYPLRVAPYPPWAVALSVLLLAGITYGLWQVRKGAPYGIAGWLWLLVTLAPVIGFIQVGGQSMADRYTYFSHTGLFVTAAFAAEGFARRRNLRGPVVVGAAIAMILLTALSYRQIGFWENSGTLFRHALAVTRNNDIAHYNLANFYWEQNETDAAKEHYRETLAINPLDADAHTNLGIILAEDGQFLAAINHLETALRLDPKMMRAHLAMGEALVAMDREGDAIPHFRALLNEPEHAEPAKLNLAVAYAARKDYRYAATLLRSLLKSNPENVEARFNLGSALLELGQPAEALPEFERVLEQRPDDVEARVFYAVSLRRLGSFDRALAELETVLAAQPDHAEAKRLYEGWKRRAAEQ